MGREQPSRLVPLVAYTLAAPLLLGVRAAGSLGLHRSSLPFVAGDSGSGWNDDDVVVRHELGHGLLWYFHGQGVGRLLFRRAADRLLEAGIGLGPRPGETPPTWYLDAYAERLLAGEAAARIHLGLPSNQITLRKLTENRLRAGVRPENLIALTDSDRKPEDIAKVLDVASKYHPVFWRRWVIGRLQAAHVVLREQWDVVERCAQQLLPQLPMRPGDSLVVPADQICKMLDRAGAWSRQVRPVAVT